MEEGRKNLLASAPQHKTADAVSTSSYSDESEVSLVATREPRGAVGFLGIGFLCFGLALGELTGMSLTPGISQIVLTSVFTFVGGVMLSYAGFRRVVASGGSRAFIDPQRVGVALACFSVGLALGAPAGVYARCNINVQRWLLGEHVPHSQCLQSVSSPSPTDKTAPADKQSESPSNPVKSGGVGSGVGLMSKPGANECVQAVQRLELAVGEPERDANELRELMSRMIDTCGLDK
jgi:hypothetical protein